MKKNIIIAFAIVALLTISFFWGTKDTKQEKNITKPKTMVENIEKKPIVPKKDIEKDTEKQQSVTKPKEPKATVTEIPNKPSTNVSKNEEIPVVVPSPKIPNEVPSAQKPQLAETKIPTELKCSLSISCDAILNNLDKLSQEKKTVVPTTGKIFSEKEIVFNEGETVFNVLLREMKRNKIHFEFSNTPIYKSTYVEGIGNLYEFDCGELSGWMYRVNGEFPNYSCSKYKLKPNDKVEFLYTCNLGRDIGGFNDLSQDVTN